MLTNKIAIVRRSADCNRHVLNIVEIRKDGSFKYLAMVSCRPGPAALCDGQ